MATVSYIKVIVPLRLEWEPLYSYEYDGISSFPLAEGTRVTVPVASRTYVAVVSCADAGEEARKVGLDRIRPILGIAQGLEPVTMQEIALWRRVASYYLCTVGEVYKAAYPVSKVTQEETRARVAASRKSRLEKEKARLESELEKLRLRLSAKETALSRARKDSVKVSLDEARGRLLAKIGSHEEELSRVLSALSRPDEGGAELNRLSPVLSELSEAQMKALNEVRELMSSGKPVLLHGVTGSGKTEIYLRLAAECLRSGRSVLYLVPEIAPADALPAASYQGPGTRSAIFLPHRNLGLIVIDEEHDTSYKQDSPAPRYNARETAVMLGMVHSSRIILGSATPSLESLYNCKVGRFGYVSLKQRYFGALPSDVEVIDTIAERRKRGIVGLFTRKLIS